MVSDAIMSFALDYPMNRRGPTTYTGGIVDPQDGQMSTLTAAIHPVSGRDIERLPEGTYAHETIVIYTAQELKVADGAQEADRVEYREEVYVVITVQRWDDVGGFWKAFAKRSVV